MMTIEEIRAKKKELGWTNEELARQAQVPLSTVAKILGGTTKNPHYTSQNALETALRNGIISHHSSENGTEGQAVPGALCMASGREGTDSYDAPQQTSPGVVREPSYIYGTEAVKGIRSVDDHIIGSHNEEFPLQGRDRCGGGHTIYDYLALPKDQRVELIDGHFYTMEAPSWFHQKILLHIWKTIDTCIEMHDADCEAMAAPFDVQLFNDPFTVVQPDVMVFCHVPANELQIRAHTAPEFVAEVLSPSTGFRDRTQKLCRYRDAGVKEVWIVDPAKESILVYCFDQGRDEPDCYSFHDRVPLGISRGECTIDFSKVLKYAQVYMKE